MRTTTILFFLLLGAAGCASDDAAALGALRCGALPSYSRGQCPSECLGLEALDDPGCCYLHQCETCDQDSDGTWSWHTTAIDCPTDPIYDAPLPDAPVDAPVDALPDAAL